MITFDKPLMIYKADVGYGVEGWICISWKEGAQTLPESQVNEALPFIFPFFLVF
jgi:hypothetical protein